jgi:L-amino acid N-acyltransferase YncA
MSGCISSPDHVMLDGDVDDLVDSLGIIRMHIPKKAGINEDEVRERLEDTPHGIKVTYRNGEMLGINVWYEKRPDEAYLWLGAYREQGKGLGRESLERILEDVEGLGYPSISVKIAEENSNGRRLLGRYGFSDSSIDNGVCIMKKRFDALQSTAPRTAYCQP